MPRCAAAQIYAEISEELGDPRTTLGDLEPRMVAEAKAWARRNKKAWPPRPRTSGWRIEIRGTRA